MMVQSGKKNRAKDRAIRQAQRYAQSLNRLETELGRLDRLGAHIAAAHLDAAIHRLRYDAAMLKVSSGGSG